MANTIKASGRTTPRSARSRTSLKQKPNEDYDPYANRELAEPVSPVMTLANLIKGVFGTGILMMPFGFEKAGWMVGIGGTCFIMGLATYCIHLMVR